MPTVPSTSRLKEIDEALGLHEIIASVRQLSYMKQHCTALRKMLNVQLEITYAKAPAGRLSRGQTYELQRTERADGQVRERLLEKLIWKQWSFAEFAKNGKPFLAEVCSFMQSYQVPLQGTRKDKKWGKIDLMGTTQKALPVVVELKQENAGDTPLRMLVEAVAYACAVRRAWNEGGLRAEWVMAMKKNGLTPYVPNTLTEVPVILVAPADFWQVKIGVKGKRSNGKVRDDAWPPFLDLVSQCADHGLPIHFVQFEITDPGPTITNVSAVHLPSGDQDARR